MKLLLKTKHCQFISRIRSTCHHIKMRSVTMIYDENASTPKHIHTSESDNAIVISLDQLPVCTLHSQTSRNSLKKKIRFQANFEISRQFIHSFFFLWCLITRYAMRFKNRKLFCNSIRNLLKKNGVAYKTHSKDELLQFSYIATSRMLIFWNGI